MSSLAWVRALAVLTVATVDGSHSARLSARSSGLCVVLNHEENGAEKGGRQRRSLGHQHPFAATLLMVLADDSSSQRDHILQVEGISELLQRAEPSWPVPLWVADQMSPPVGESIRGSDLEMAPSVQPRPPPQLPAYLVQLRATVLLI